jgi:hypothetical protein
MEIPNEAGIETTGEHARQGRPYPPLSRQAVVDPSEESIAMACDKLSLEALLGVWRSLDPGNSERIEDLFANFIERSVMRTED